MNGADAFFALPPRDVLARLGVATTGLSSAEAAERLQRHGPNELRVHKPVSRLSVMLAQVKSPLVLLLLFAAIVSMATHEWVDAGIVIAIVAASAGLGFAREYSAQVAVAALSAQVRTRASVLRDGKPREVDTRELVPGDVVLLAAGCLVPADAVVLEATDCHVNEAVLTGESFPIEKRPGAVSATAPLGQRFGVVFLGTNVRSGSARCVVVTTGQATEFGSIAHRLSLRPPETEFERGIRRFGTLLTIAMLVMVLLVFAAHVLGGRPAIETLLFAIALAVGLSPELLPAILSVNLARGAKMMGERGVLVRHLAAIENLGSMDVLCSDKTGTLTEGVVQVDGAWGPDGAPSPAVLELAVLNAVLGTGLANPLDQALLEGREPELADAEKLAEVPFDFIRKRASVVVKTGQGVRLIVKGAVEQVLDACASAAGAPLDEATIQRLHALQAGWAGRGIRSLAVATRTLEASEHYGREHEVELELQGFVTFLDRPKAGVAEAIVDLGRLGVTLKLITGDSRLVAQHIAGLVGLRADQVVTGRELARLNEEALWHVAERTDIFAEVDPNQKERIILALKKTGHVVGFLGDGVNDAPAMHAADTSLSVQKAVDVARAAADFVLLEPDLEVIRAGIEEGRRTFANTFKYIMTTTSANLGNMVSMALGSLFLSFLPLTAGQVLLNNFLSDVPAFGLATDSVDAEMVARPRRWDMRHLGRFMVEFGLLSTVFDFLTFGVLLLGFGADPELFRTGWFVESLLTELVIALVVRTRRPLHKSRPGRTLLVSTAVMIPFTLVLPYVPFVDVLGFVPLPPLLALAVVAITITYVVAAELTKHGFYRRSVER